MHSTHARTPTGAQINLVTPFSCGMATGLHSYTPTGVKKESPHDKTHQTLVNIEHVSPCLA